MSFLDRFKIQPRYKSPDPDTRAAAVQELGDADEDAAILLELAREDEDARVRRAALDRIDDVDVLAAAAGNDPDEGIRAQAIARLLAVAVGPDAGRAERALAAVSDQKQLADVAMGSPIDAVRTLAIGRVTDLKALSSIARKANDPRVAALAADRIQDPGELINVAAKTDHKDAGVAALERAASMGSPDRDTLEGLASRARNKSVGKRARAMVQALDEAEAARRAAVESHQVRLAAALARVEALAASAAHEDARRQLEEAEADWSAVLADAPVDVSQEDRARFAEAVRATREAIAEAEQERAAALELAERLGRIRSQRASICERVEALRGEDALDRLSEARAEWEGLAGPADAGLAEDPVTDLIARFEEACRRAAERHANREDASRAHARLDELSREAEQLAGKDEDVPAYVWEAITREWTDLASRAGDVEPAIAERYDTAGQAIAARREARHAAAEKALRQHVQRLEQLIDRAAKRASADDITLKEADKAARDLRAAIDAPPLLPPAERDALVDRLKAALSTLAPKLHELREMDEWKRFANAAVQEELIAHTEALKTKYDWTKPEELEKGAHELHEIQERWKHAAEAPRAQAQALWHRYRQAADPLQALARGFFAQRAEERQVNLTRKLALCEQAEALSDSTDWIKTAEELKRLQAEWQAIGPVPRADTRIVWKRFRDACDRFFSRRNADLAERKETWAANQARKEALIARAEELADSKDWDRTAAEIRRLQAEWKTIGPVRRSKSEAIWQRFRAACDHFFERYKRRDEIELESRQADREALAQELEGLLPAADAPAAEAAPDLLDRVRSLRTRWNQSTSGVRHGADPLSARFVAAMERLLGAYPDAFRGTELDVDGSRQRMEKLCSRIEGFVGTADGSPQSTQDLATMLREALAANTIGGRGGDEAKWRSMADEVRQAQASFARLVPVPGDAGRQLSERFQKACNRFFDQYRRHVPPSQQRRPVGTR
jgi:hypothetical protein